MFYLFYPFKYLSISNLGLYYYYYYPSIFEHHDKVQLKYQGNVIAFLDTYLRYSKFNRIRIVTFVLLQFRFIALNFHQC